MINFDKYERCYQALGRQQNYRIVKKRNVANG